MPPAATTPLASALSPRVLLPSTPRHQPADRCTQRSFGSHDLSPPPPFATRSPASMLPHPTIPRFWHPYARSSVKASTLCECAGKTGGSWHTCRCLVRCRTPELTPPSKLTLELFWQRGSHEEIARYILAHGLTTISKQVRACLPGVLRVHACSHESLLLTSAALRGRRAS